MPRPKKTATPKKTSRKPTSKQKERTQQDTKVAKANKQKSRKPKETPKKQRTQTPKKQRKHDAPTYVDDHKTFLDPPRKQKPSTSSNKKEPLPSHQKRGAWGKIDKWLTALFILCLFGFIAGVIGLNRWSQGQSQQPFHHFETSHLQARFHAFVLWTKKRLGPPNIKKLSLGFEREIHAAAIRHRIPSSALKALIRVESNFRPTLMGRSGSIGLTQILPTYTHPKEVKGNLFYPQPNIRAAAIYLRKLLDQTKDLSKAVVLYHARNQALPLKQVQQSDYLSAFNKALLSFQHDPGQHIRQTSKNSANLPKKTKLRKRIIQGLKTLKRKLTKQFQ